MERGTRSGSRLAVDDHLWEPLVVGAGIPADPSPTSTRTEVTTETDRADGQLPPGTPEGESSAGDGPGLGVVVVLAAMGLAVLAASRR